MATLLGISTPRFTHGPYSTIVGDLLERHSIGPVAIGRRNGSCADTAAGANGSTRPPTCTGYVL